MTGNRFAEQIDLFKGLLRCAVGGGEAEERGRDLAEPEDGASVNIGSWEPLFALVADLVRDGDEGLLKNLYSGSTELHAIIGDDLSFRTDAGFAQKTGTPFREGERAAVHAIRALAGLGLALIDPALRDMALSNALDWYTNALGSSRTYTWDPRRVDADWGQPLQPLMKSLADAIRDEHSGGAVLTVAVTLYTLAVDARLVPPDRRGRKASVTVLLVHGEDGRADLQMSVVKGLPTGFVPDPRRMNLFSGDRGFQQSLEKAWSLAGAKHVRGTVLWSIKGREDPIPQIHGESAGAALTVTLDEIRRLSRPPSGLGVFRRLRAKTAIVGRVDDLGLLQSVDGYADKFAALPADSRVIVPVADAERARSVPGESKEIIPVKNWKEAARKARRSNRKILLSQGISVAVVLALTAGGVAFAARDQALTERYTADSGLLATQSEATDDNNPPLARLEAVAAWNLDHTSDAAEAMLRAAFLPWNAIFHGSASINSVALSPNGETLAVGTEHGAELWNLSTGKLETTISPSELVYSVAFSLDGQTLAIGGQAIELWDVTSRTPITTFYATFNHGGTIFKEELIFSVAFSPDGKSLAAGTGDGAELWNLSDHRLEASLGANDQVFSVAFSPNGETLAAGEDSDVGVGGTQLWDVAARTLTTTFPGAGGNPDVSVAFSPNGGLLAAAPGVDVSAGGAQLWDVATRTLITTLPSASGDPDDSVAFSPNGKTLAVGTNDGATQFWDAATTTLTATLPADKGSPVESVAFGGNGVTFVTGTNGGDVQVSDTAAESVINGQTAVVTTAPGVSVGSVALSPNGKILAVGLSDGAAQLWNATTGTLEADLSAASGGDSVISIAFSPNGATLAVGRDSSTGSSQIQLWNVATRTLATRLRVAAVFSLAFSPNGATLAVAPDGGGTQLWDIATRKVTANLTVNSNESRAESVSFSPNGATLAVGTFYGTQLWDVASHKLTATIPFSENGANDAYSAASVAFSPDGKDLAEAIEDSATEVTQLGDTTRGQQSATSSFTSNALSVMFGSNGTVLLISTGDQIQMWDLTTDQLVGTLNVRTPKTQTLSIGPNAMAFNSVSSLLAIANGTGSVELWSVRYLTDITSYLCGLAAQSFPAAQWAKYAPGINYQRTCAP